LGAYREEFANARVRTTIAVLGAALTVTISTAAIAPNAYARKNNGCNQACQIRIGKNVVIDTPCDQLQNTYNAELTAIGDFRVSASTRPPPTRPSMRRSCTTQPKTTAAPGLPDTTDGIEPI
jgi:hypothetical protein